MNSMKNLAIIPARSGSKGVKDKNIRMICGQPLIAYSIQAAKESHVFETIHVSTDSEKYAQIAREYGADVPFLRTSEYATDVASTWDAVRYVQEQYAQLGKRYDMITVLQPTSPLREAKDICEAYKMFCEKEAKSVISVCETEYSPTLCKQIKDDLSLNNFIDINLAKRRQEMPKYYRLNGSIYMLKTEVLKNMNELYGTKSYAYIMEREKSIDIDDELDIKIAEILLENTIL